MQITFDLNDMTPAFIAAVANALSKEIDACAEDNPTPIESRYLNTCRLQFKVCCNALAMEGFEVSDMVVCPEGL